MRFTGDVEVKTLELPDALEFTVTREESLFESVVAPIITFIALWYFWKVATTGWPRIIFILVGISSVLGYIANKLHGRETRLRVTDDGLIAEGNLGQIFSKRIELAASDITRIRFHFEGEGSNPGLYVWHGWASVCLIPAIGSEEADKIVEAIANRFPHLPTELSTSAGWRGEKLIELGLSKLNRDDSNRKS